MKLNAILRNHTGKGASRQLRRDRRIPAVIYGAGSPSRSLALNEKEASEMLERGIDRVEILGVNAIVKDVQTHPVTDRVLHLDFEIV